MRKLQAALLLAMLAKALTEKGGKSLSLSGCTCSNHVPRIHNQQMKTGPQNQKLQTLIEDLRSTSFEKNIPFWKRIAADLSKSTRNRRAVNLSRINRFTKDGETIIVPGKVLATGELDHKVTIAAWQFSGQAKEKIEKAGFGNMNTFCLSPSKFTFPYSEHIVVIEVASEKSHQSVKKYCEQTRRDVNRKGMTMTNLMSLSLLDQLK